jgi:hypothetical protein
MIRFQFQRHHGHIMAALHFHSAFDASVVTCKLYFCSLKAIVERIFRDLASAQFTAKPGFDALRFPQIVLNLLPLI